MSQSIHVLHLISGLGQGGAEQMLLDITKQCQKKNIIRNTIVSFSKESRLLVEFEKNNIDVTILYKTKSLQGAVDVIKKVLDIVKGTNIDIIHAHMSHAMIVAGIIKMRYPKIKVVFTQHNINIGSIYREVAIFCTRPLRDVDILFSRNMHQWFNKHNYTIIPNGVNMDDFIMDVEKFEIFTFLAIGNIKKAKNYPFLIECAKELREKCDFRLLIIGEGEGKDTLEEMVKERDLGKYVSVLGYRDNIGKMLNQSHCLVMPSLWEGMPVTILEAGASKLPIISTKVGAIPTILDENSGYLTDLEGFQHTMAHVLENYSESIVKVEKFHKKVSENYTIGKVVGSLERLYMAF